MSDGYAPSPWGAEFHRRTEFEVLGAGSAGPGKSVVLQNDPAFLIAIEDARCREGEIRWGESTGKILHLRRELGMLEETIGRVKRSYPKLDPDVVFKEEYGKPVAIFRSGFKAIFGGCKDLRDYEAYQSAEYVRIYYDELSQFEKEQYDQINSRCRSSDPVLSKFLGIRAATNPTSNWVRARFVDPAPKGKVVLREKIVRPRTGEIEWQTRVFLPATLYDNPDPVFVAQYEKNLLSRPAHIRNALLYGDWYTPVGGFYAEEWRRDVHVIPPFRIPGHWPRFRSLDWGYKTFGCCLWWAVTPDGDIICTREFSFRYMEATKVALRIREIEEEEGLWDRNKNRSKLTGPADTNLWEDRGNTAISKAEEMAKEGVSWKPADKSSKSRNAMRFITRLKDTDGDFPGIAFFEDCRRCIKTIPGILVDPNDSETPAKSDDDHWHDATLYACAYRAKPANENDRDWYEDDEEEVKDIEDRRARRGRYGYGSW